MKMENSEMKKTSSAPTFEVALSILEDRTARIADLNSLVEGVLNKLNKVDSGQEPEKELAPQDHRTLVQLFIKETDSIDRLLDDIFNKVHNINEIIG
jgi:hypothetical protein